MKYILTSILLILLGTNIHAQVKIGGTPTAPDASAILELDGGTTRGLLLPRMRKISMDAIPNPAEGLTVYVTDEQATYLRRSGDWVKTSGNVDAFSLPYFGTLTTNSTMFTMYNYGDNGTGIVGYSLGSGGFGVRGFTFSGTGINGVAQEVGGIGGYFGNNSGGTSLVSAGKTGIGTTNPSVLLEIDGSGTTGNTIVINDDVNPVIQLNRNTANRGRLQLDGNDLVLATNTINLDGRVIIRTNNADRLFVNYDGLTGIGAPSVGARLYVDAMATGADAIIINDQNPNIQFQDAGVEKGFIQTSGNDLRLGTNLANTSGNIIMRTKGFNRMRIDSNGHVSMGTGNYDYDGSGLTVHGGGITIDDDYGSGYGPLLRFQKNLPNNLVQSLAFIYPNTDYLRFSVTNRGFEFTNQGDDFLRIVPTVGYTNVIKRLGISTDNPTAKFYINGIGDAATAMIINDTDPVIQLQQSGVSKGYIQADGNNMVLAANISNAAGKVVLRTGDVDRLLVNPDGRIIVGSPTGTSPAGSQMVKVKGGIQATDFTVTALAAWPDYVFADGYKLKSLEETEAFIKTNKHLPNIPAAAVVEKEGFALGDMQKRMMEKIEELTLHLIESKKQINQLNAVQKASKDQIDQLKQEVSTLQSKK